MLHFPTFQQQAHAPPPLQRVAAFSSPGDECVLLPDEHHVLRRERDPMARVRRQLQVVARLVGPLVQPAHNRTEGEVAVPTRCPTQESRVIGGSGLYGGIHLFMCLARFHYIVK